MKSSVLTMVSVVSLFTLSMISCTPAGTPTPLPTLALDAPGLSGTGSVGASAEVVPAKEARLSFLISGPIEEVAVQEGDAVTSGQVLATLNSPELEYGLLQAQSALRASEADYQYWQLPRRVAGEVVERGELATRELEQARKALETAHAELAQTQLVAPFAGTVIAIQAQPGEVVGAGQVVIVLAQLDTLKIETTDLSERHVAALKTGQPATVYVEALDQELQGAVTAISPVSNTLGGDVVFQVTVQLEEQPADLRWGMSADVEIQTE